MEKRFCLLINVEIGIEFHQYCGIHVVIEKQDYIDYSVCQEFETFLSLSSHSFVDLVSLEKLVSLSVRKKCVIFNGIEIVFRFQQSLITNVLNTGIIFEYKYRLNERLSRCPQNIDFSCLCCSHRLHRIFVFDLLPFASTLVSSSEQYF